MPLILGIDEAGKGSVIGSLFIAGVLAEEKDLDKLKEIGVKDSKLLTHKKRMQLETEIKKIAKKVKVIKVLPKEIDEAVESMDGMNLNWLEAHKQAEIINELKPDKAVIDCPSPNIKVYTNYLIKLLNNKDVELIVEHHADTNFVICGSASIIAKCEREKEVLELKKRYGDIGPGYSSNEITQKFVKENLDRYPEIFRKSWMTYKNHDNARKQRKMDEFVE